MSYPGQFETAGDGGLVAPPGWVNPTTPGSATVKCGYIVQSQNYTANGATPLDLTFDSPASWSDASWVSDLSGVTWTCIVPGIYYITVAQNLTVLNTAETVQPVVALYGTLTSTSTSEFNQVIETSQYYPIMTGGAQGSQMILTGLVNATSGSTLVITIVDRSGNLSLTSGFSSLPSPVGYLGWHLIAAGAYGNTGVIV